MTGRKGRSRKAAVKEQPDAGQENVIDSTTEILNANIKNDQLNVEAPTTQKRGNQKKTTTVKEKFSSETKSVTDAVVVAAVLPAAKTRGQRTKKNDAEEVIVEKINIVTAEKAPAKRGRRKLSDTNGDAIQNNIEKINGNEENPVDKKSLKKIREVVKSVTTKQSVKTTVENIVPKKSQSRKAINEQEKEIGLPDVDEYDDLEENKPVAYVQPLVTSKKPKGRKKAADVAVAGQKHKMNGTGNKDHDEVVVPIKKGRVAKTKAQNNMKESTAATDAADIKDKKDIKKTKKITAEVKKSTMRATAKSTITRAKRATASIEKDDNIKDEEEQNILNVVGEKSKTAAKKRKVNENSDKINKKPEEKKSKMNATATSYDEVDFSLSKNHNLKISSWNVAGLRAWLKKGGMEYITYEKPDIFCLQELKCAEDQIPEEARISGYHPYWLSKPGGFNGIAIYSKIMPINVEYGLGDSEQDDESRIMTAEYEKFYLICVYVPNAGRKLVTLPKRLRWNDIFHKYILKLNDKKPVIICGDMNVAHNEIDLTNPKTNKRNAGFTQEERDGMSTLLSYGFVDTFRHFNPNKKDAYTFWTYMGNARAKNVGWRLDYFLASEKIMPKIVDNVIRSKVLGSDHCPITLLLNI